MVPLCLLLTAKSASRFIFSAFCAKENVRVSKQQDNQSLFKGTPTSFPSTLWTTTASGDVMDALTQVMIAQSPTSCDFKQASRTNAKLNLSESNEEVSERLSKFEKEIDSVEPDQV